MTAPYVHTDKKSSSRSKDWLVAILPVLIWSVFMFGARVITLCVISAAVASAMDYCAQRFVFCREAGARFDLMVTVYGILSAMCMPVTATFMLAIISGMLVAIVKNIRVFYGKRLFNPYIFSAAALNVLFPHQMTAFTRPFAYFSAFDASIDPVLVEKYRVISPLMYMADGSVYEDGVLAQLYGFASGAMGEIAVFAMILAAVWLFVRREADWRGTVACLVPILLLALAFPSDDAESNYYAYSVILSGAIVFISVFAVNESHTVPLTPFGKTVFGFLCGVLIFALRKLHGGFEWGYFVVLALDVASPFIEKLTKPRALSAKKNRRKAV